MFRRSSKKTTPQQSFANPMWEEAESTYHEHIRQDDSLGYDDNDYYNTHEMTPMIPTNSARDSNSTNSYGPLYDKLPVNHSPPAYKDVDDEPALWAQPRHVISSTDDIVSSLREQLDEANSHGETQRQENLRLTSQINDLRNTINELREQVVQQPQQVQMQAITSSTSLEDTESLIIMVSEMQLQMDEQERHIKDLENIIKNQNDDINRIYSTRTVFPTENILPTYEESATN